MRRKPSDTSPPAPSTSTGITCHPFRHAQPHSSAAAVLRRSHLNSLAVVLRRSLARGSQQTSRCQQLTRPRRGRHLSTSVVPRRRCRCLRRRREACSSMRSRHKHGHTHESCWHQAPCCATSTCRLGSHAPCQPLHGKHFGRLSVGSRRASAGASKGAEQKAQTEETRGCRVDTWRAVRGA